MTKEELYELLDIESGADFQYFENLADFIECGEDMDFGDVAELVEEIDREVLAELIENYFNDMAEVIPGSEGQLFTTIDNVQRALLGLCRTEGEDGTNTALADELDRFRRWYSVESRVAHRLADEDSSRNKLLTLRDALVYARLERLDGTKYIFDFSRCGDYHIDEYVMSLGDVVAAEYGEGESGGE